MRKFVAIVLITSSFLFAPSLVRAEDNSRSPRPVFQRLQNIKQEVKDRVATRTAERQEKLTDLRRTIVTNFFNTMLKRLQAAEDRLNKILARIETRVAKIKTENPTVDLTNINSEISSVNKMLTNTQAKIDALKVNFTLAATSETPKESFKKVLGDVTNVKKDLQEIRKQLSKIIGDIKGLHVGEEKSSDSK